MINNKVLALARTVWDYHHVNHTLVKSDCILTLGSHDTRVADRAADLYHEGWAPLLIFSGGLGRLTEDMWTQSEADLFADIAVQRGVPREAILVENRSTNTGENILLVRQLLQEKALHPQTFIVVQKPYMERRSLATFEKAWPGKQFVVTSPQIAFEDYPNEDIPLEQVINIMVGDLQRIKIYPGKGFQTYQEIPAQVWQAYEELVALGFNKQLLPVEGNPGNS
ncbi:MAG: YdcF family protein [Bacteroidota bacterium]|nr:YdcF family protein [Bacteroidota bacterium]